MSRDKIHHLVSTYFVGPIFALFLVAGQSALCQENALRGTVTDSETGGPLPGANVLVTSQSLMTGAASDANGRFEMTGLPPGTYTIEVSFIGYEKRKVRVRLGPSQVKRLDFALKPIGVRVNPVTVTASKRPEKLLDAPASITVIDAQTVEKRTVLTAADHLKALPAVDVISAGLNQSRVVIRGFNDLFSGSLLSMVDNRITRIPAVRLNAFQLIPTSNLDIDRIEVVSGPASALYGPNSANGVVHVLTKSPFDSRGTAVSLGGGERNVLLGTIRHAGSLHERIGYKLSLQYYRGKDFPSYDAAEQAARQAAIAAGADPDTLKIGARIFDIESTNFDARVDFRVTDKATFIVNGGFSRGDNIEMTNQGAAQALDASFKYIQGRFTYKNLFFQAFLNKINTGNTYFLRTGQRIINNSSLFVTQLQHNWNPTRWQNLTYGLDVLLTRPATESTVNGRNEDHDNVDEVGGYLQSETTFSSKLKLVTAARLDHHNRLDGLNFSPRAALVFKPSQTDNFRFTFNKAFSTPTSDALFADNLGGEQPTAALDPLLVPFLGETFTRVRALGTWPDGFTFNFVNSRPQMVSPFGVYLANHGLLSSPNAYLAPDVNSIWPALRELIIAGASDSERPLLNSILPRQLRTRVPGLLKVLNTETQSFDPVDLSFVQNVGRAKETTTTTFEVGYKGVIGSKLLASADLYHSRVKDFIGPLRVVTPNVFIDPDALEAALAKEIADNGFAALAPIIAREIAQNPDLANFPIGVISPQQVQNGTDVILTNRNVGDVSVVGFDLSLTYYFNRSWNLTGNYSFVNRDFFRSRDGRSDIALNAPKHKVGAVLNYRSTNRRFSGELRLRFVDDFPVNSGIFVGKVKRYAVLDLNANYKLPFLSNAQLTLTVQNLANNKHREFVGVPEIGRLSWIRLTQFL